MRDVTEALEFAGKALEPSSRATYDSHIRGFNAWAKTAGVPPLGPLSTPIHLARYLKFKSDSGAAGSSFKGIRSGLAFAFRYLHHNPTDSKLVADAVVAGRKMGAPTRHREPLERAHLLKMSACCFKNRLAPVRDFFSILLAWRGFLRGGEAMALLGEDLELRTLEPPAREGPLPPLPPLLAPPAAAAPPRKILVVYISSSKMNPQGQKKQMSWRERETVLIGPDADPALCPIIWFERYSLLRQSRLGGPNPGSPLFFSTTTLKARSGSDFNETVKEWLGHIDVDATRYGGHSARSGGATEAARKAIDIRLIKRQGRWKSDAVYIYIRDDEQTMLALAEAVGNVSLS
jgi:hypothetical protein